MSKNLFIIVLTTFVVGCSSNNTDNNPKDNVVLENKIECNSKCEEMKGGTIYPDSLTAIQKSCVEKLNKFMYDLAYEEIYHSAWEEDGYLTSEEIDAVIELSLWDYKKRFKPIEESIFYLRINEVFGFDLKKTNSPIFGTKCNDNLIVSCFADPFKEFYLSKKERVIMTYLNFMFGFKDHKDLNTFILPSRKDSGRVTLDNHKKHSSIDYLFHLNNYVFNEANVSRTWLLNYDKYFMSHLLMDFGYDGDNEINKMVLKKNQEKDTDIIDIPLSTFHTYPNGKVKILDNLLKTAAEMSTAECSDHFVWATSVIDSFCVYNQMSEIKKQVQENEDNYTKSIKSLTDAQKRELVGHITNYMQPVYEKYLGTDLGYGDVNTDLGDMRILDCFWNYMMDDHEIIAEFEDNNYYGLSDLKSLIDKMKDFKPFYNEENSKFEPWHYTPMRYKNSVEEN